MLEVVARRYDSLDYSLSHMDVNAYLTQLQADYPNIAELTDLTLGKIRQVLRKSLVECGMLKSTRSNELLPIVLDFDVQDAIEAKGDYQALAAFGCRR